MDRKERREKERELKKREEKIRTQEEKLRQAGAPSPSQNLLKKIGRAIFGKTKWLVGAAVTVLTVYAVARPHVSVEPSISLNPVDPYTTQFTVKNENSIFEARDVHCVCWPRKMQTGHNIGVLSLGPLPNVQHTIPILSPGGSSTVDCPPVIGGLGAWTGEVLNAELEIVVSYKQSWWPLEITERNAFSAKRDSQHGVHWVHITPAEEKPLLPF
jgi:hypothetical protein